MSGQSQKVKTRINATKKTAQITKAMNMVSASKLKGAENAIKEYLPFIAKTREIIVHLASDDSSSKHPLMEKRTINNICYLVISSDRGLAGAFNANVCKELTRQIKTLDEKVGYTILPIGLKAYAYAKKQKYPLLIDSVINIKDDIEFSEVAEVIRIIVRNYLLKKISNSQESTEN